MSTLRIQGLAGLLVFMASLWPASAGAETMGLGPDARESIEEWAGKLGLTVKGVEITVDHAAITVGGCGIILAHDTGSRCSGLHLDAGGARACLSDNDCMPFGDFQKAIAKAGAVFPPWRVVEVVHAPSSTAEAGDEKSGASFATTLRAAEDARLMLDETRARTLLNGLLHGPELDLAQRLRFVPALGRLGLGGDALRQLGSEAWLKADTHLAYVVRFALFMGPSAAVSVADAILAEHNACDAVPMGQAFALVGDYAAAAAMGGVLRQKDVKCFEAYALEVAAGYQAGERQACSVAFHAARGRFPDDPRLGDLELFALRATGQWRAAKYVLDQRMKAKKATAADLAMLVDVLLHEPLLAEAKIAWATRLEAAPTDPIAAFLVGVFAHVDGQHSRSFTLLEQASSGLPGKAGRLHTIQALNALSLGDVERSKAELRTAIELAPRDYQGHWAAAEVFRDVDPLLAQQSLDIALNLLPHRAKQSVPMKAQRAALATCDGTAPCGGPWRYKTGRAP